MAHQPKRPSARPRLLVAAMLLVVAAHFPQESRAAEPDWSAVAEAREIFALTVNEDGSPRDTKIWITVLDGQAYIRTSKSTRWGKNVVRTPDIVVRIDGVEHPVHVTFIEDDALRERVIDSFREKYGATDWWLGVFRGRHPRIMRLDPRSGERVE